MTKRVHCCHDLCSSLFCYIIEPTCIQTDSHTPVCWTLARVAGTPHAEGCHSLTHHGSDDYDGGGRGDLVSLGDLYCATLGRSMAADHNGNC
ncbi:hypothetical protein J6590_071932 [Homalodisca vitripennis]|nr:hypothetical protein J6590_071932 [Homalodisca vitripennis]